jgi:hypothetical protein
MSLNRTEMDISKYIKVDEIWYGIDRTEGEEGLKLPVRSELVMNKKTVEAQLILNLADDLINYSRRTQRGIRKIKDAEDLEVAMICAENPANAGVRIIEVGVAIKDPYYIKIYLNKTFGICQISISWSMCSDETFLVHYMNDLKARLKARLGEAEAENAAKPQLDIAVNI